VIADRTGTMHGIIQKLVTHCSQHDSESVVPQEQLSVPCCYRLAHLCGTISSLCPVCEVRGCEAIACVRCYGDTDVEATLPSKAAEGTASDERTNEGADG
jgi:hypothetical protein